jgi:hypothetical protein
LSKNLADDCPIYSFFSYKRGRTFYNIFGKQSSISNGKTSTHLFREVKEFKRRPGFFSSR